MPFPKVIRCRQSTPSWKKYSILCLLEPSELFSYGHYVSIYIKDDDGFEVLIGVGSVLNIQDDGKILIGINMATEGYEDTIKDISNNDKKKLDRLRIKPNIPHDYLTRVMTGGFDA